MDFMNKTVIHKTWGNGVVCEHNHPYFSVRFGDDVKKFSFPGAFAGFLRFDSEDDQNLLENMLREHEEKEAQARASRMHSYTSSVQVNKNKPSISGKPLRKTEKSNIVFKCNYCDGGSNKYHIGYMGACSDKQIRYNIEVANHSWCSDPNCPCSQYLNGEIDGYQLDEQCRDGGFTCYESKMLIEWAAFAGFALNGEKKEVPRKIKNVQVNSLAVLTTRKPYASEEERFVFGVFLVDDAEEGDNIQEGCVRSTSKYRIELSPTEAPQIKFWNYHANDNNPSKAVWSQGLYRYITDTEAVQILRDIVAVKRLSTEKKFAEEFLAHFCRIKGIDVNKIPERSGALTM